MEYNVDYFIKKFEAIPEEKWCVEKPQDNGRSCAIGHCGVNDYVYSECVEARVLLALFHHGHFRGFEPVWTINDGHDYRYNQATPKQRILAALYDIKKAEQPEVKERIVYVTVDAPVRELQKKELVEN